MLYQVYGHFHGSETQCMANVMAESIKDAYQSAIVMIVIANETDASRFEIDFIEDERKNKYESEECGD